MKHHRLLVIAVALVVALLGTAVTYAAPPSEKLSDKVQIGGIVQHLQALQQIADENGGTRASITPGYTDSVDYVVGQLEGSGYEVTVQPFTFAFVGETAPSVFERLTPTYRLYATGAEYLTMAYSGSGNVTARIWPVDVIVPMPPAAPPSTSTSGCEMSDFAGFPAGSIALMQRGTCTFRVKAENARAAGAIAVIIFNEGQVGRQATLNGTLNPPPTPFDRPVIGTSYAVGAELVELWRANPNVTVHIFVQTIAEQRTSYNVLAETRCGDPNNVDMMGAHLDSVVAGPGINDNGTGSAHQLEIAIQLAKKFHVNRRNTKNCFIRNMIRFAWWGAEEQGLIGSRHYTNTLTPAEREQIDLYLNYDMNGSPNYVRFVGAGTAGGPPGSDDIERVYKEYFDSQGLATDPTPFDNRSDYGAFTPHNIPAGFLFTGAEGVKTPAQAAVYGGTAGEPYDRCYHQACDTIDNVNQIVLLQMAQAAASVLMCWANSQPLDHGAGGPAPGACFTKDEKR